jgi:cytochrome oxidase Cu insertion factor (SCO1/SenC/PrrC family)
VTVIPFKLAQTLLFTLLILFSLATHASVSIGQAAPDFTGVDSNGNKHTLSQYKGNTVVLEWTNHDCP